jgi:UDP-glucose 4-epimerase
MKGGAAGQVFNIGGGARVTINHTIEMLQEIIGKKALVARRSAQPGDVRHTLAETSAARRVLGFVPQVGLEEGLQAQVAWQRMLRE